MLLYRVPYCRGWESNTRSGNVTQGTDFVYSETEFPSPYDVSGLVFWILVYK